MYIKIRTSKGFFVFGLSDSKYESFARLIAQGFTHWTVDASEVCVGADSGAPLDTGLMVSGWFSASERVIRFIKYYSEEGKLEELVLSLKKSSSPGILLDSLVN